MRAHGLGEHIAIEYSDLTEDGGYEAAMRLLGREPRPTAIFTVNDLTCLGALSAAGDLGVDVPHGCPWSATTTPTSPSCAASRCPVWTDRATR
ncbi:MAG: hypothetical protein M3O70_09530 [Actinomycetota bacterium]|nr:hypothetical protein [Actinomycetota bacterium]